jgi:SAM-dependent methyltransferase
LEPYLSAIPRKATAVEIGCGSGFFLEWLGTAGFDNLIGYEPSAAATASAPDAIRPRLRQCFFEVDESLPPGSVDLICSFQTLDHLTAPLRTLEKCRSLLYPGGTAFFITHNERALQARLLGEKSPIIDIEHIYLFNRKTLRLVFERAGFDVIDVISIQNTYSLLYWLSMTPIPLKGLARSAIRFLGLQDMPISLHAGNIGIIARSR